MAAKRCVKCRIGILTTENVGGIPQVRCENCGALTFLQYASAPLLLGRNSADSSVSPLFALALPRLPETLHVHRLLVWLRRNDIEAWTLERLLDALEQAGYHCYKAPPKWTLMAARRQAAERERELVGAVAAA